MIHIAFGCQSRGLVVPVPSLYKEGGYLCSLLLSIAFLYIYDIKLHWLPLSARIKFKIIFFVYKAFLGFAPIAIFVN